MPEEDLPAKLDAYLTAYRATPAFHPFEYVFRDILATQPEAAAALAERDASKAREEEVEKAANGGYSGWKAVARKAFIESDPLPTIEKTVEKKIVKPTDPGLSRKPSFPLSHGPPLMLTDSDVAHCSCPHPAQGLPLAIALIAAIKIHRAGGAYKLTSVSLGA